MSYRYTGFIPQNIAPKGVTQIGVYSKNGRRLFGIPLGWLTRPQGEKRYSFGLLSDLHVSGESASGGASANGKKLDDALSFFEEQGCAFCAHAGDMTNVGFWHPISEAEGTSYYNPVQMAEYKSVCDKHDIPVYGCCGNHESYNGYDISDIREDTYGDDPSMVVDTLRKLEEYTGHGLHFDIVHEGDVFLFLGQPTGNKPMSDEAFVWLSEMLEANRHRRCFVFVHSYVKAEDSGNPYGLYGNNVFAAWGSTNTAAFIRLMKQYPNTILFHGHSHMVFDSQEQVENAIYSEKLGFRSMHVPSLSSNRKAVDGALVSVGGSYGYLVDVYDECVVFNGLDMQTNTVVPIATYCVTMKR